MRAEHQEHEVVTVERTYDLRDLTTEEMSHLSTALQAYQFNHNEPSSKARSVARQLLASLPEPFQRVYAEEV